ncbi:MAG TPA: acyl-CoA dehydratase activase-related protein, partial [bacterium]|nr:acyl-CoA dehydratase activase-related protein [bacterium]
PLYYHFFTALDFGVVLAEKPEQEGIRRQGAPFCYPVEQAHGYLANLLAKKLDYIFLPQVKGLPTGCKYENAVSCPLVQGEPYYLQAAFPELEPGRRLLSPIVDFSLGFDSQTDVFVGLAVSVGADRAEAEAAYSAAIKVQQGFRRELKARGRKLLAELESNPDQKAMVIFGRSYNAFSAAANMGIPHKFAARGWTVIPCDFFPMGGEEPWSNMYWATGQVILEAARIVSKHPRLFGVYITNFSCGPDSFLVGYFRQIMGAKPSLTLELDGHTADAGIDTRVEAFLDIVQGYLELDRGKRPSTADDITLPATIVSGGKVYLKTPVGDQLALEDPRVTLLVPAMGERGHSFLAAVLKRVGVKCVPLPPPGHKEHKLGQAHSNCKECLPLQLTVGSLLRYLQEHELLAEEQLVYFMPETSGPCRFGQYQVFINRLIRNLGLTNVSTLSLNSANSYGGLGTGFTLGVWLAIVIADVMSDIRNTLLTLAQDQEQAQQVYEQVRGQIMDSLARDSWAKVGKTLTDAAAALSQIALTRTLAQTPKVAILGEIYVRADAFSRQGLIEYLAAHGIISRVAPVNEWLYYCDYLLQKEILAPQEWKNRLKNRLQGQVKVWTENIIKAALSRSGLYQHHLTDVEGVIDGVRHLISPTLTGEAILTIGGAVSEIIDEVDGVIAIGPFGCMPNRIAEAVAGKTIAREKPRATDNKKLTRRVLARQPHLPFMAIESDGNVFPQVVEARLESFILQVKRLHEVISEEKAAMQH